MLLSRLSLLAASTLLLFGSGETGSSWNSFHRHCCCCEALVLAPASFVRPQGSPITRTRMQSFSRSLTANDDDARICNRIRTPTRLHDTKNKHAGTGAGFAARRAAPKTFPYAGKLRPGAQTPQRVVTDDESANVSSKPDYWKTGVPSRANKPLLPWIVEIKSADEISKMREAGALARHVLDFAGRLVQTGVTTDEIDAQVHHEIIRNGAYPSPLNYHGFPKSCCTSVNEVICHGIPDDRKLVKGDIINLDITVYLNGYHGDCSEMFVVHDCTIDEINNNNDIVIDPTTRKLLQATYDCWISACQFVAPGNDYKDIGAIIEDYVTARDYTTVKQFCGHGLGATFHTNPNILHYRNNEPNGQMVAGHTFTIEPMICEGTSKALTWPDEWTATTADGLRSAQFEHSLLITPDGVEALTGKTASSPLQFWERDSCVHQGIWLGTSASAMKRHDEINAVLLRTK